MANKETSISPYFEFFRSEIVNIVPAKTKYVLSVGCAAGKSEAELVERGMKVIGVEMNHEAAQKARQRGLTVLEGDVSEVDIDVAGQPYDCLIYADVLEHLPDPAAILNRHVAKLKAGGTVIVSVPNFRYYSVFWNLFVLGHIKYVDSGILDRTHLRVTTRKMVLEWFELADVELVNSKHIMHRRRDKLASACLFNLPKEFLARQLIIVGAKR